MRHSKYLRKLLLFSMVLVTLPVIFLGMLSYGKARAIIQDKVIQGNIQVMAQTELKVEQLLQIINSSMIQFISSTNLTQALRTELVPMDYPLINDMAQGLRRLQSYEMGIRDVRLTSLRGNWILDNSGYTGAPTAAELSMPNQMAQLPGSAFWITDESGDNVRIVKKLPLNIEENPDGLLEAIIPASTLQKLLPGSGNGYTFIIDAALRPLTDVSGIPFPEQTIRELTQRAGLSDLREGYVELDNASTGAVGMTYRKSTFNDWTYISLFSIEQITAESRAIGWYTLTIGTVMLVLLFALSFMGSRRIYSPIRSIFEAAIEGDNLKPVTQRDELKLIGERIQSLKSSQLQLLDKMQGQQKQLKELFVRKLILGELGNRVIEEQVKHYYSTQDLGPYGVITVQIDTFNETRFQDKDRDLLMFAVSNIAAEIIPSSIRLEPVVHQGKQITLVGTQHEDTDAAKHEMYIWAEAIQSTVKEILGLQVSLGISRLHSKLTRAAQAYNESLEALKYRIRFGEESILHVEDVLPDSRAHIIYPEWLEKQLIEALLFPDLNKAGQLLHEFLTTMLRQNILHREYQMMLFRLLANLVREVQNTGEAFPVPTDNEQELFEQLFRMKTLQETEDWFMKCVMEPMVLVLGKKWEARNQNISGQMKDIIHNEFMTELTLEVCAARLNYHPNYLKTVFRKETGANFSEYLSLYRLNQSKCWLLETEMKIAEIAAKIGYQNAQNYIRYFRKMENMTPGEYRKKYRST
ncbi:helix-turn-helix domain-containing protein [Paenibacillus sp. FSL H7-0756]|uniref:helix-turn-helix domain-containing protein n=1 Tax=unclassified Paenibacillus TaxID=185978 RepID=UPI0030F4E5B6